MGRQECRLSYEVTAMRGDEGIASPMNLQLLWGDRGVAPPITNNANAQKQTQDAKAAQTLRDFP